MRWDGTKWRSAGSGTDGHSFYLLQNNLVLGGQFPNIGRIAANEIAELSFTTEVEEVDNYIPSEFSLSQNYPNPFNPTTTIRFLVPQLLHVTLKVFDVLGREVATLVDGELNPGEHSVVFNAKDLPSGVYFYRLITTAFTQTKSMEVIK